ncbi:MAG: hypothetical protein EBS36_05215 [Actinobacteria bacterium]|nr:hypothetical protein [Actinomycetota bacterium]NBY14920.1 hypothetical protein [Actinomycetota bacterium]
MLTAATKFLKTARRNFRLRKQIRLEGNQIKREFELDKDRYLRHSTPKDSLYQAAKLEHEFRTQIDRDVHRVEKGLALRNPKRPFGKDLLIRLQFLLAKLPSKNSNLRTSLQGAIDDLTEWNSGSGPSENSAPQYAEYKIPENFDLQKFFWSRKSLRVFSDRPVDRELISQAVDLARNTPSVCNRQSWQVYAIDQSELLEAVLPLQNGNESFRSEIKMALVITSDLNKFSGAGERNQVWIDGGLFSMSLAWALHGLGLGTCMLNWSVLNSQSERLRQKLHMPDNEEVMMLMAVGHPETNIRFAKSEKKLGEEILIWPTPQMD